MALARGTPATARNNTGAALTTGALTTTSGNMVVVALWTWGDMTITFSSGMVTDSKGNTYTLRQTNKKSYRFNSAHGVQVGIWEAQNISGGSSHTCTFTPSGGTTYVVEMLAVEVSGAATSGAQDVGTSANGASATPDTGATSSTSQADEIIFAVMGGTNGDPMVITNNQGSSAPTNFVELYKETDNSAYQAGNVVSSIVSATGAKRHVWG